eukprot:6067175-Amphidinium_carterae.1
MAASSEGWACKTDRPSRARVVRQSKSAVDLVVQDGVLPRPSRGQGSRIAVHDEAKPTINSQS